MDSPVRLSLPMTVLVAARNEEANLGKCLASLGPAARVVVLDSGSTDRTVELARAAGAEVVQFTYVGGYPKKRQWALDNLSFDTPWLMFVDADEEVPPALWAEIAQALQDGRTAGYAILKEFHFLGRRFRFGGFSHAAVLLVRVGCSRFERLLEDRQGALDMEVHERLIVDGCVRRLSTPLVHRDFKGLDAYRDRHRRYADWEARLRRQFLDTGRYGMEAIQADLFGDLQERRRFLKRIAIRMPGEPFWWFLYHYVVRLGFLEGSAGWLACRIRMEYIRDVRRRIREPAPLGRRMNILLVNQFYPPSLAPTGRYLQDLAFALAARGHAITVVCSRQSYGEGAGVAREAGPACIREIRIGANTQAGKSLSGKAWGYAGFLLGAWRSIRRLRPRPDVVVAMSTPPWIGWVAFLAAGARCRKVHWVMDLYPQVLAAHQMLRTGSPAYRLLRCITRHEWRRASLVIAPGDGMVERIRSEGMMPAGSRLEVLPLWSLDDLKPWPEGQLVPLRRERAWPDEETILLYTGNMGLGHEIGAFLQAATRTGKEERWRMVFSGWGKRQSEVEDFMRLHPDAPVERVPVASPSRLSEHLASADVHLASMRPGWSGLIVPSKVQAAFAAGRPVLFVGPEDSDPSRWIRESGGGWSVAPEDKQGLLRAIRESGNAEERRRRGTAACRFAAQRFSRATNCAHLAAWVESV